MRIVLAGGTGLLGSALSWRLTSIGHHVVVLTRDAGRQMPAAGLRWVEWVTDGSAGAWASEIEGADAVVNLAGANLADRRWTDARKAELQGSRVLATRSLVAAMRQASARPGVFLQASGAGFYGIEQGDRELDESFPPGDDFIARLCVAWEAEAHPVTALGCRLVILRSGVVLAREGGALARMRWPFRWFVGGPVASGEQYVSWIHHDDWVALAIWALSTPAASGILNASAPEPVTNAVFSQALGRALNRPCWLRVPAFALHVLYGEIASVLVRGQRVVPRRALELGFTFTHPSVPEAMEEAVGLRT